MDDFLKQHWDVMAAYPLTFVLFAIVVAGAVFAFARIVFGAALEASRERFEAARDEVARLRGQKDELIVRLEKHGEDIEEIKAALAAAPKTYISEDPPPADGFGKHGDTWLQIEK